jgi:hypothetical protein
VGRSGNTTALTIVSNATICPGIYYGGIEIASGTTTMLPGLYWVSGGEGFKVGGTASIDGTAGVTVYAGPVVSGSSIAILPNPDLAAPIDPNRLNPTITIKSDKSPVSTGAEVKYSFEIERTAGGPNLNGTVNFYDGDTLISDGSNRDCKPMDLKDEDKKKNVDCKITYTSSAIGQHGIAAVFISSDTCTDDTCHNNAEAVLDPYQIVVGGSGRADDIELTTTGNVQLSGSKSGPYKGIVIYQDRQSDGSVLISHGSGLAACSPSDSITVNGVQGPRWALQQPPGPPCGPLGGIEGTIYAPHFNSLVTTTVSGLADVQVIAGKMLINSLATTRFAFDPSKFAGNRIALFE